MPEFLLKLDIKDKESLGAIRCMNGLHAAEKDNFIWIKGINALIEMEKELMRLPAIVTFITDEQDNLFIPGKLTPVARLEELQWEPLTEFLDVEAPVAALPGKLTAKLKIKLIPSSTQRNGTALITTLDHWKQYAETAPATRLFATKFAVSENNEVLILGDLLPPLPGMEYWRTDDLLIPSGYDVELSIMREFINTKVNESNEHLTLFRTDGSWQKIDKTFLVASKRSAIRLTVVND